MAYYSWPQTRQGRDFYRKGWELTSQVLAIQQQIARRAAEQERLRQVDRLPGEVHELRMRTELL